jgi:glutamate formiminotransferase/formiminotetrahydrofolate cyclodeaminase
MKIVECVPNFSEGKNKDTLEAISNAVKSVSGVKLLDVDPGEATNRTVFTFAGDPEAVLEAAFQAIKAGMELIDMRQHKGAHARQGACDVCPFVPVSGITMEECVELANRLGKRVGEELDIPIYLYAEAAKSPERVRMPDIRVGEYEALEEKLKKPEWKPDYGPAKFNAKAGATVIGARKFLIAYNINLNTTSTKLAKNIAFTIRETGRLKRDEKGEKVIGSDGKPEREPGMFKHLQGTGWLIPEYNRAQITVNILDIEETPVHKVFDACCDLATKLGARVTGSEVVGMVPKKVMVDAGNYFLAKQGTSAGIPEELLIETAIQSLGLRDVAPFEADKKIIEHQFLPGSPLASMTVKAFSNELSSSSPAPGGGSVAALSGGLSCALSSMVAVLTHDKKGYEEQNERMERIGVESQKLMREQIDAIDRDTDSFNRVMDCFSMPKSTDEEKAARDAAIQEATKEATMIPLHTLERTLPSLELAHEVAQHGNQNSLSDAGVAGLMARAAAYGAYYNVLINLASIEDKDWTSKTRKDADKLLNQVDEKSAELEKFIKNKLE